MTQTRPLPPLRQSPEWQALQDHRASISATSLRELFGADPDRAAQLTVEGAGFYLDYSKQRVTAETMRLLLALAQARGVTARAEAMFAGQPINTTEDRAVLHVALRAPRYSRITTDGVDVVPQVHAVLDHMGQFADDVREGRWLGHDGRRIRNVVSIGIGGSDLGPVMAYEALRHYSRHDMRFRFVSNVDGTDFTEATRGFDQAETLFIICSKTLTMLETLTVIAGVIIPHLSGRVFGLRRSKNAAADSLLPVWLKAEG